MKTEFKTLAALYAATEGRQVTLQEIIEGRTLIAGQWENFTLSPEAKEAAFSACVEIIGGHKATKEAMLYALKWNETLSHWGLRRLFLVQYSSDKAPRFTYCCGQDWPTEMRSIRAYLKGR